jgi:site-specific DNA recombinase
MKNPQINTEMKYVAGYARVSTPGQVVKGSSMEVQRENIKREAEYRELEMPVVMFEDRGESGTKADRHQYSILKEEVKLGRVSHLIIFSVSRLGRDLLEMLQFIKECEKAGVVVYSICEQYDSNKPHTKLHLHILGAVAENQIQETRSRIKASLTRTKEKGIRYSKEIPIGYELGPGNTLISSDKERAIIMRIKNLKTRGHSYKTIADRLNEDGIRTKKGKVWNRNLVFHYLNNNVIAEVGTSV